MKKILTIGIIVILLVNVPIHIAESSDIIYVDDDNTTGPWDGSMEYPYQYIQYGVDNAEDGDTVYVRSGYYYESVIVNKAIELIGEDKYTTTVSMNKSWQHTFTVYVDYVVISNFTICNVKGKSINGIQLNSDYNTITNNKIVKSSSGVRMEGSNNIIRENYFSDFSNNAISSDFFSDNNNNTISNNYFVGCNVKGGGVNNTITGNVFESSVVSIGSSNAIINNTFHESGISVTGSYSIITNNILSYSGIILHWCKYATVSYNTITDNGIYCEDSQYNNINNNKILGAEFAGISIQSDYNIIRNNSIDACKNGIFLRHVAYNIVTQNHISNNTRGIYLCQGSIRNTINKNNFISNQEDAFFQDGRFNIWNRNYWGKPLLFKIIFGNINVIPVISPIPWLNFDWHPAKEPYDIPIPEVP